MELFESRCFPKSRANCKELLADIGLTEYAPRAILTHTHGVMLDDRFWIRFSYISFILDSDMCLYEHQSTFNPNMPLRGLFYFSDLLQKYVADKMYDIYGSRLVPIPIPNFVVFYNGDDNIPERSVLKLSDAFMGNGEKKGSLEVEAWMLDVNEGRNRKLMESCGYLKKYAAFVGKVKEYRACSNTLDAAIDGAVRYCVEHDIMKDILRKHKAEVAELIFREFDEAEYFRQQRESVDRQIKAAEERARQFQQEIKLAKEETKQAREEIKRSKEEAERLRRILKEHGWSE